MKAEEILKNYGCINSNDELDRADILLIMKEWGDAKFIEGRDRALEWASENVELDYDTFSDPNNIYPFIDKESILYGKTAKDLQP